MSAGAPRERGAGASRARRGWGQRISGGWRELRFSGGAARDRQWKRQRVSLARRELERCLRVLDQPERQLEPSRQQQAHPTASCAHAALDPVDRHADRLVRAHDGATADAQLDDAGSAERSAQLGGELERGEAIVVVAVGDALDLRPRQEPQYRGRGAPEARRRFGRCSFARWLWAVHTVLAFTHLVRQWQLEA